MAFPLLNVKFIILISASFIAIFSSIAIYFCLPILISHSIRSQIALSLTSGSFNDWKTNSVIDRVYLYNISNYDDLFGGQSKTSGPRQVPKLKQVGPFTFRQDRDKLNIKFDTSSETVTYDQRKTWTFLPELSHSKSLEHMGSSTIYHINVPLAGTTLSPEYAEFINPIVSEQDLRLFLNHSVKTLLFDGYYDILMEQAKATGKLDVDKFGWMHNQNNSITKDIKIFTGPSNTTLSKFGSIDEYQGNKKFLVWHNNQTEPNDFDGVKCNEFRLSSPGEFFPPPEYSIISHSRPYHAHLNDIHDRSYLHEEETHNSDSQQSTSSVIDRHLSLVEKSDSLESSDQKLQRLDLKTGNTITLFMPDLCRTIKLVYNGSYNYKDLLVDRYIANELTYVYSDESLQGVTGDIESNKCYCLYSESTKLTSCPPNGMMDLFTCRKGSPITISFPHFLYSTKDKTLEPYLKLFEDGIEPQKSEHQFFVDLESTLNLPVKAQIVLQFNVHLRYDTSLNFTNDYSLLFRNAQAQSSQAPNSMLKDLYLPQMWIKSSAEIDEKNLGQLKFIQKNLGFVTPLTTIIMFGFASILLMASAKLAYDLTYGPNSRKPITCDHEACASLNGNHASCSYFDEKKKYFGMESMCKDTSENDSTSRKPGYCSNCDDKFTPGSSKKADLSDGASKS